MDLLFREQQEQTSNQDRVKFQAQEVSLNPCFKQNSNSTEIRDKQNYFFFQLNDMSDHYKFEEKEPPKAVDKQKVQFGIQPKFGDIYQDKKAKNQAGTLRNLYSSSLEGSQDRDDIKSKMKQTGSSVRNLYKSSKETSNSLLQVENKAFSEERKSTYSFSKSSNMPSNDISKSTAMQQRPSLVDSKQRLSDKADGWRPKLLKTLTEQENEVKADSDSDFESSSSNDYVDSLPVPDPQTRRTVTEIKEKAKISEPTPKNLIKKAPQDEVINLDESGTMSDEGPTLTNHRDISHNISESRHMSIKDNTLQLYPYQPQDEK